MVRFGRTRREAEESLEAAVEAVLRGADAIINRTMPLLEAGEYWLKQIARPDSGLSARTIADYSWTWQKYIDSPTSSLRGLTRHGPPNVLAAPKPTSSSKMIKTFGAPSGGSSGSIGGTAVSGS